MTALSRIASLLILLAVTATESTAADAVPSDATTAVSEATGNDNGAAWRAAGIVAAVVFLIVIVAVNSPGEPSRPLTNEEIKNAHERLLDTYSELEMWQAVARGDGDALREQMKLIELRQLRRLNERQ